MLKHRLLAAIAACILVASFLPVILPAPVRADSTIFYASKGNYMGSTHPNSNYGSNSYILVGIDYEPELLRGLVEFDIDWGTDIPDNATITAATLEMYIYNNNGAEDYLYFVQRLLRLDWSESTSTWNNYKSGSAWTTAGAGSSTSDYTTAGEAYEYVPEGESIWMSWDILTQVQYAQTNTVNVACRVVCGSETGEHTVHFFSDDAGSYKPKLTVTYTAPDPPTVITGACTDPGATSLTANGEVTDADGQTIIRRGFTYMEGEAGDPADVIEVLNPSFESGDPPDDWSTTASATLSQEAGEVKLGTYSAKVVTTASWHSAYQDLADYDDYKGETVTLGAWVWCDAADKTLIRMYDGTGGSNSAYHSGSSDWEWLTVTRTIDASATQIRLQLVAQTYTGYFDGVILIHDDEALTVYEDGAFGEEEFDLEITGLNPATSYRVRAFAQNDAGIGYGSSVTGDTLGSPSITTLDASNVASTSARLNSSLGDDGGEGCTIKFGWGLSSESAIEDYDSHQTLTGTYTTGQYPYLDVSGLLSGYTYYFRVSATNAVNTTLGAELEFETESSLLAPTNFIGYPEATSISLSWSKGTGSTNTLIRYGTSTYPGTITAGTQTYFGTSNTHTVDGLTSGKTYYFSAWGESGGNYSASYATFMMTTSATGATAPADMDVPTQPSRWFSAPDYTTMAGLLVIYDSFNSIFDSTKIPRATGWFLLALGMAFLFSLMAYLRLGKKLMIAMIVMTVLLGIGYFVKLIPWWLPLMTLILTVAFSQTHKQVEHG